jgi:AraC family transcriptional regulator
MIVHHAERTELPKVGGLMSFQAVPKKQPTGVDEPNLLPSLATLLNTAREKLDGDHEAAKLLLTRATSLLRVAIDRREAGDEAEKGGGGLAGWQARRLVVFIDARLDQPIRLSELSEVSKLSTAYFCRSFKRTFGETPHSYIVRRRLDKAETLMLTSDLPLSQIAVRCGFTDQAHLCKLFRQQRAQSPAAWRRQRTDIGARKTGRDIGLFVTEAC